jgi:hypothetical protein
MAVGSGQRGDALAAARVSAAQAGERGAPGATVIFVALLGGFVLGLVCGLQIGVFAMPKAEEER